uniref:Uncharacterized protein n=1 Tax=Avena sativa TaxID=4498 RepID=A0ACD5VDX3_AVESA
MKPFFRSTERCVRPSRIFYVAVVLSVVLWALIFHSTSLQSGDALQPPPDLCAGRYVYMYDLPPRFNADLARDCRRMSASTDMCRHVVNDGFGPPMTDGASLPESGAYATDQYMLELIFHARMRQYECLTADPAAAAAVYVPFYAEFDLAMTIDNSDMSVRNALPRDLVDWLARRPEWRAMGGRDHFMLASRPTWDLLCDPSGGGYGNSLMTYPAIRNMTVLAWEASPRHGNDFAVPYPSHFHPSSDAQVVAWQSRMRGQERQRLWCFAGGPRHESRKTGRNQIIEQCRRSSRCALLGKEAATKQPGLYTQGEYLPSHAMRLLESAEFCIQPRGDSYTRKSIFDTILAGCIPVFLHPISAYVQYTWYLPRDYRTYSVFIPQRDVLDRNASIEEVLTRIPPAKVAQMREEVIRLIPTVMYRDPAAKGMKIKDAFDIAVERVIGRVEKRRRAAAEGDREYQDSVDGYDSWKYDLLEDGQKEIGPHEFDPYMFM